MGNVSFFFFFLCFALGNVDIIVGVPVTIMDQEVTLATGAHVTEEQDKMPGFPTPGSFTAAPDECSWTSLQERELLAY